jgi:hypothetical protein
MIRGIIQDEDSKYNGRNFIAENEDSVIILVEKGTFLNGSEMYAKFDRSKDDFVQDNN